MSLMIDESQFPLSSCETSNDCIGGHAICGNVSKVCECRDGYTRDLSMHISIHCTAPPYTLPIILGLLLVLNFATFLFISYKLFKYEFNPAPKRIAYLALGMVLCQILCIIAHYIENIHGLFTSFFFCSSLGFGNFMGSGILMSFITPVMKFDKDEILNRFQKFIWVYMSLSTILEFAPWVVAVVYLYLFNDFQNYNLWGFLFLAVVVIQAILTSILYKFFSDKLLRTITSMREDSLTRSNAKTVKELDEAITRIHMIKANILQSCFVVGGICLPLLITFLVLNDVPYRFFFWMCLMICFPQMAIIATFFASKIRHDTEGNNNKSNGNNKSSGKVDAQAQPTVNSEAVAIVVPSTGPNQ